MTNTQLYFAIGVPILMYLIVSGGTVIFLKNYLDAKIDPLAKQMDTLVSYMILHEGKIATLEERTKKLG